MANYPVTCAYSGKPIEHLLLNNNVETISTYADPLSFDIGEFIRSFFFSADHV